MVSIIIPVYNEEKTIGRIIDGVISLTIDKQIIVVDDGSTDATAEILRNLNYNLLEVITHDMNIGKGAAIRTGLGFAKGDFAIVQDADLELDPSDIIRLIEPLKNGKALVSFGIRKGYRDVKMEHLLISAMINLAIFILQMELFLLYGYIAKDMMVGYKAMPVEIFKSLKLKSDGFEVETEIITKLLGRGVKPLDIPVSYSPRYYCDGKKIKWFDALKVAFSILKYRFHII